jgi:hypothetical protein
MMKIPLSLCKIETLAHLYYVVAYKFIYDI